MAGAKWATFERFGSPMPDWDQWDAEALELIVPWFSGDHFVTHLFAPQNEHRIVLTKLQNLALVLANGQWDARLESVTNAMLHAALAAAFWLFACRWIAVRARAVQMAATNAAPSSHPSAWPALLSAALFVVTAALFGLPLAWQNILGGLHSVQYWLLGLSFVATVTLPFERPGSRGWWTGMVAAALALLAMGSGLLAAAVVVIVVIFRWCRREPTFGRAWLTLACCAVLIAIGLATRVEVPWHEKLKVTTAHDFFLSIVHSLQWPFQERSWAAAVLWLPWLIALGHVLLMQPASSISNATGRDDSGSVDAQNRAGQALVAVGGWVLVQIVATAWARGAGGGYPASRYMDTLAFGAMANAVALAWLLCAVPRSRLIRSGCGVAAVGWLVVLGWGLHEVADRNLRYELPDAKKYYVRGEGHLRRYLGTENPKQLAHPGIPFPSAEGLIDRLGRPAVRALMPLPIRAALPLAAAGSAGGFVENDARDAAPDNPPHAGISPATPPLDATKTWGSFGATSTVEWTSAPLATATRGWLKFETAGAVGESGVALELHDARTGAFLANVAPTRVPGDSWRAAYVRAPRGPFVVVARDADPQRWLAFSGPVEMGWLSYWAWQATRQGLLLVYTASGGALMLVAIAAWSGRQRRRARSSG